ncbi:hypothetical protein OIU79_031212 [Salix purpurea]|uniref:Uncharacterized protein n=1 Tax=Salix purpurea TaxID=77065 RepID=A0A9Q0VAA8_SALPP|nr:hypothetical protein OIU79_031212 [Salix purpurea]
MELPRTTSSNSHPNSLKKFRVSSSTTTSRPSTDPSSRHPRNDFEPSLNIEGETTSNVSTFNRPGDRVLQTTSSSLVSSNLQGTSYMIQRQSMITEAKPDFEAELERLKKSSEMEAETSSSSKNIPEEIIKKCQEAEMSLRQGLMLAKQAQELLRSAPDEGLFSA